MLRLFDVRPRELDTADFQQQDKTGVTQMCKTISPILTKLLRQVWLWIISIYNGDSTRYLILMVWVHKPR
jgi:hypothetical protein